MDDNDKVGLAVIAIFIVGLVIFGFLWATGALIFNRTAQGNARPRAVIRPAPWIVTTAADFSARPALHFCAISVTPWLKCQQYQQLAESRFNRPDVRRGLPHQHRARRGVVPGAPAVGDDQ